MTPGIAMPIRKSIAHEPNISPNTKNDVIKITISWILLAAL